MREQLMRNRLGFLPLESDKVTSMDGSQKRLRKLVHFVNYVPEDSSLGSVVSKFDFDIPAYEQKVIQKATNWVIEFEDALNVSSLERL